MDLQYSPSQIEDPVVRDSCPCVCRSFPTTDEVQARLCDLDDERWAARVSRHVVARRATNHADVGLRLRAVVEDDRALGMDEPAFTECSLQRFRGEQHGSPVGAVLWLLDEEEPVEQLYRVVLVEDAVIDQPRVLTAGPTT